MANRVRFDIQANDQVTSKLGKIHDTFDRLGKSQGFKSVAQGFGMGAGISGWRLLSQGITAATDFLGDSIRAFADEEASIAKLDAALKANVKGWDGNRDAIEGVLEARMDLGFSDDEQRDSLALLTAATGDATRALNIQRTAMDLARLKGISLAQASEALVKVEAGQFRMLKSLGIELRAGATQQEALTAVQRVATGQAEAYADTLNGKVTVAQIKFNEAQEDFGKVIAPVAIAALDTMTGALDGISPQLQFLTDDTKDLGARFEDLAFAMVGNLSPAMAEWVKRAQQADSASDDFRISLQKSEKQIDGMGDAADEASEDVDDFATAVENAMDRISTALSNDPLIIEGNIAETKLDLIDAQKRLEELQAQYDKKPSQRLRLEIQAASGDVRTLENRIVTLENKKDQLFGNPGKALLRGLDAAGDRAWELYRALAKDEATLRAMSREWQIKFRLSEKGIPGRAHGGPVSAGQTYMVGERGPELFTPNTSGNITPNGAWGGVYLTVNYQSLVTPTPAQQQAVARALVPELTRELRRAGSI